MPMTHGFFEQVASSIREVRGTLQNDLDQRYPVTSLIVLDQLTERLADTFAVHYPHFKRDTFLDATRVPQGSDHLTESACDDPDNSSRIVYTIETTMRGDPPKADTRSFSTFAEAKSAMTNELERRASHHAQLGDETGVRIIGAIKSHLYNALGPEWQHFDGSCELRITLQRGVTDQSPHLHSSVCPERALTPPDDGVDPGSAILLTNLSLSCHE
jgi:hypothetical protein